MLHIAGNRNEFNSIISLLYRMFHCSLHVLVLVYFSYSTYKMLQTSTLSVLCAGPS